ncbi:hypothetical protein BJF83_06815 [Nocardiopsis sp. CNR-923]|uniref:hypothetical protein n=1 Tax=Nocardiopsis sp. CNR-923 TaxID=1904965 RepID=UPI00095D233C|nr:hypothetical protein [Nocardiopsis sp. CNR-923]OLT24300.1 hypothetical protein BJF83_06815 [Nocardiopsis sp. CNR-923]
MSPSRLIPAALLAALALTGCGGAEPTAENAAAECENYIEHVMESPGDIDFDDSPEVTLTAEDPWEYEVVGSAGPESGSGTAGRTEYTCIAVNNSGDWHVVDLRADER